MTHRRIPKKNRKKLKSVDPFNTKGNAAHLVKNESLKKQNNAPVNIQDEQPLTKAMKSIFSNDNKVVDKQDLKKKKKQKNAVLREAEAIGLKKGRFETVQRFVKRVEATMHNRIRENLAIAKQGLAGRNQEEIDADYAKIEEAEKRRKEQEKREVENKIKEARKRREHEQAKREEADRLKAERKRKLEEVESFDEESEDEDNPRPKKKTAENVGEEKTIVKLSKKDRRKETLKTRRAEDQKQKANDALINGKEKVEFGERYDAPPTFGGALKKKFEPLMAKAGQKTLLLHSLLQKGEQKTKYLNSSEKIQEERQRVIDAYRQMKKQRNLSST